ncbi:hypothetical protein BKA58DRAFT_457060 [Alternaria rosae]|uniref:uncharacterized protein n=1 Tax=Alternaria rosae TaxID=1187941 RepID=UPI001E8EC30B|nr:uncharacterized protein BKA58DRAFT_449645 [Alternaria rosae]XP_046026975.1 uncharacterized protein BKA58DRAFT_457060 [Alternaria rosae]KAH6859163.1 hypothetical protein BKA58DRAFT_449645 [Alternaria rosae]KAH6873392.1 hypothetical protein BKA58DRAFT_457060 [Alternaria rosae]
MVTTSDPEGGTPKPPSTTKARNIYTKPDFLTAPFLNVYKRLPAHLPSSHAHIIKVGPLREDLFEGEEQYDLKIQDAVATLLFQISKDTLDTFLSGVTDSFKLVQSFEGRSKMQLIIWKQGTQVLIGQFIEYEKQDCLEWDNLVRCTINYDGSWGLYSASFGRYTRREHEHAWSETFIRTGINRKLVAGDEKQMAEYAGLLSEYIIVNECWSAGSGSKWNIETAMAD